MSLSSASKKEDAVNNDAAPNFNDTIVNLLL